jgi:hypothetical protein
MLVDGLTDGLQPSTRCKRKLDLSGRRIEIEKTVEQ